MCSSCDSPLPTPVIGQEGASENERRTLELLKSYNDVVSCDWLLSGGGGVVLTAAATSASPCADRHALAQVCPLGQGAFGSREAGF